MDPKEFKKFEKDVSQNHDTADVKSALERDTADGSGFDDESELDTFAELPREETNITYDADSPLDEFKPDPKEAS